LFYLHYLDLWRNLIFLTVCLLFDFSPFVTCCVVHSLMRNMSIIWHRSISYSLRISIQWVKIGSENISANTNGINSNNQCDTWAECLANTEIIWASVMPHIQMAHRIMWGHFNLRSFDLSSLRLSTITIQTNLKCVPGIQMPSVWLYNYDLNTDIWMQGLL
jgi:hypothetical protein